MVIYTVLAKKNRKNQKNDRKNLKKMKKIKNARNNFWGPCQVLNQTQKRSSCYRALLKLIEA